jgi:cell filamentation protein
MRYAVNDPYTYDDSSVLRNIPGIRNASELEAFERVQVTKRFLEDPPPGDFNYPHLKALHHHLFQDVYSWAGQERNVPITKGGNRFATPAFLHQNGTALLRNLHKIVLALPPDKALFAETIEPFITEFNVLHPFREGNGRVTRYFLFLIAESLDYEIAPEVLLQEGWLQASISGFNGNPVPMRNLIEKSLRDVKKCKKSVH